MTLAILERGIHALGAYSLESVRRGAIPYLTVFCISEGVDRCVRRFFPKIEPFHPSLMEEAYAENRIKEIIWVVLQIQIKEYIILKICHLAAQAFLPKGSIWGLNASTIAALMLYRGFSLFLDIKLSEREPKYDYWFFRDHIIEISINAITLYYGLPASILMENLELITRYYSAKYYLKKSLP